MRENDEKITKARTEIQRCDFIRLLLFVRYDGLCLRGMSKRRITRGGKSVSLLERKRKRESERRISIVRNTKTRSSLKQR